MASLADLFVRVRGDTTDVTNKLRGVERLLAGVGAASVRSDAGFSKLRGSLTTLASQITGTNPAIARLGSLLGEMVAGGPLIAGITAGAAAIAGAYSLITKGAREAAEAQRKLSAALVEQFKPTTGPNSDTAKRFQAALQERADLTKKLAQLQQDRDNPLIANSFLGRKLYDSRIQGVQDQIKALNEAIGNAMTGSIAKLDTVTVTATSHVKELVGGFNELRDMAGKVNDQLTQDNRNWWKGYIDRTGEAIDITGRLEDKLIALLAKGTPLENLPGFGTAAGKPLEIDIPALVQPTVDQAKKINEAAAQHAQLLKEAIWGSASASANAIVSALNVGGGGRGSSIGAGLGGDILGIAGRFFTRGAGSLTSGIWGIVGGAIGSIVGSLTGALFDHPKSQEQIWRDQLKQEQQHNEWLKKNHIVLNAILGELQNAPSGYKVAAGRYDATRVLRQLGDANRRWVAGGGVSPLTAGTL